MAKAVSDGTSVGGCCRFGVIRVCKKCFGLVCSSKQITMSPFDVFDRGEVHTNTSPRHSPALAPRLRYRLLPEARIALLPHVSNVSLSTNGIQLNLKVGVKHHFSFLISHFSLHAPLVVQASTAAPTMRHLVRSVRMIRSQSIVNVRFTSTLYKVRSTTVTLFRLRPYTR